jgi:hypothetical protein
MGPPYGSLENAKTPAVPARVLRLVGRCSSLVALGPPCPSVPPGAGNKPKKATKPRNRAKEIEEGYVGETGGIDGDMHAPAVRRDDDGDLAAMSGLEPAQVGLHVCRPQGSRDVPAV